MKQFDYDILLEYLSWKKSGTWEQFKKYVFNLDYDDIEETYFPQELMRTFSRLGHIEFKFKDKAEFSICPPAISLFENGYKGVLCGYRTKEQLELLKIYCERNNLNFYELDNYKAPKNIIIDFKNEKNIAIFEEKSAFNIKIVKNFSENILTLIPSIDEYVKNLSPYDGKPARERYDLNSFKCIKIKDSYAKPQENILYSNDGYIKKYYLTRNNNWLEIDKDYGIFYILKQEKFLKNYINFNNNKINLKKNIQFPELIDRTLTLQSGLNPKIENDWRIYDKIDLKFAKKIFLKLSLSWES